jgi:hypothetical protein
MIELAVESKVGGRARDWWLVLENDGRSRETPTVDTGRTRAWGQEKDVC